MCFEEYSSTTKQNKPNKQHKSKQTIKQQHTQKQTKRHTHTHTHNAHTMHPAQASNQNDALTRTAEAHTQEQS